MGIKNKILIVEDEPTICDICQQVLTGDEYDVDCAENGRKAQSMVLENHYDMLLIDLRMPEVNGKEFYRWLSKDKPDLFERVIFTTGDVIGGDTKEFLDKSKRPFLPKPFTPTELENIVRETFDKL